MRGLVTFALLSCMSIPNLAHAQGGHQGAVSVGSRDPLQLAGEYGIARAFSGEIAKAESAFIWILAHSPGDARALVNLGNLSLLRGDIEVALAFYERASAQDTTDAGIPMNEATAYLLLGDDEAANERAGLAIRRAGGASRAGRLAGLRMPVEEESPKAATKARVTQDEILTLLRKAAVGVPVDSLAPQGVGPAGQTPNEKSASKRHAPVWRSAGARAGDPEAASVLYWKH